MYVTGMREHALIPIIQIASGKRARPTQGVKLRPTHHRTMHGRLYQRDQYRVAPPFHKTPLEPLNVRKITLQRYTPEIRNSKHQISTLQTPRPLGYQLLHGPKNDNRTAWAVLLGQ